MGSRGAGQSPLTRIGDAGGRDMRTRQMRSGTAGWVSAIGVPLLVAACASTTTEPSGPTVVSASTPTRTSAAGSASPGLIGTAASDPSGEPSERASDSGTPTPSASLLPDLDMPGARSSPPGEYGWDGGLGSRAGMHKVVEMAGDHRQTQIVFAVENDCFASGEGPEPVPTTVAGLDGWYVEPYDGPGVLFMPERESGQTTGGYALSIGDRTLCVYLTWDLATTTDELGAARQVVESIRGHAFGPNGIRITFTLPNGWDVG